MHKKKLDEVKTAFPASNASALPPQTLSQWPANYLRTTRLTLRGCHKTPCGEHTPQRVFQLPDAFPPAFAGRLEVGKHVFCGVNGPPSGGGADLAAFGDLVTATPRALFAHPKIRIGIFPPLASTILPFL